MPRVALLALVLLAGCGSAARPSPPPGLEPTKPLTGAARLTDRPDGPRTGRIAWRRRLEGPVVPGPVQGPDGTVYAASNGGVLHALDPETGRDRWTFDGGGGYGIDLSTSPVVSDGVVLWPGPGALFALDARSGRLRFKRALADPHTPAVRGDRVYVQGGTGTLTALTRAGRTVWTTTVGTSSYASPAVGADGTVYTAADRALVAVRDGRVAWRVQTRNLVEVSPAVTAGGVITVGSNDHHQYGVSPAGRVLWRYDLGDLTYSSAAVTPDGLVYVGDHRGQVSALDERTGALRFRVLGQGRTATEKNVGVWTRPVVDAHHAVYFGTHLGHVHGFGANGARRFDVDLGGVVDSYPTLTAGGLLVVGSEAGTLTAIG